MPEDGELASILEGGGRFLRWVHGCGSDRIQAPDFGQVPPRSQDRNFFQVSLRCPKTVELAGLLRKGMGLCSLRHKEPCFLEEAT